MISYRIDIADLHTHHFEVTLQVPRPAAQQELSLPVWIPGSYMVREFGRHLSVLRAWQGRTEVPLQQLDKTTWRADCADTRTLRVSYRVYAFDTSVRTAFLDDRRGFFNGTSLCLRVEGREAAPPHGSLGRLPPGWSVATAMPSTGGAEFDRGRLRRIGGPPVRAGHLLARRASRPAACRTSSWWLARGRASTASGCWPTPGASASADRVLAWRLQERRRRSVATCSCSMRWTTATVAWSTAPARR
jgi:predicted metalloprotease with PDZ domain